MLGVAKAAVGRDGSRDVAAALALDPQTQDRYSAYGIHPPKETPANTGF